LQRTRQAKLVQQPKLGQGGPFRDYNVGFVRPIS
jgi:hypothetical protein